VARVLTIYRERDEAEPYIAALEAAGLRPVLVSADETASLQAMDGLLLMGGSDVDPALYGEQRGPATEAPDPHRDRLECELIGEAIQRDLPVFAICRGLQILNVQQGGTLQQDLRDRERHVQTPADRSLPAHPVRILPGTLLARIAGTSLQVNSRHHQGIAKLAPGLRISAVDPEDGTIEAVERPGSRFVLAVQWHPENQAPRCAEQAELFRVFAEASVFALRRKLLK
jgi:putative glutamine amidotransferase